MWQWIKDFYYEVDWPAQKKDWTVASVVVISLCLAGGLIVVIEFVLSSY